MLGIVSSWKNAAPVRLRAAWCICIPCRAEFVLCVSSVSQRRLRPSVCLYVGAATPPPPRVREAYCRWGSAALHHTRVDLTQALARDAGGDIETASACGGRREAGRNGAAGRAIRTACVRRERVARVGDGRARCTVLDRAWCPCSAGFGFLHVAQASRLAFLQPGLRHALFYGERMVRNVACGVAKRRDGAGALAGGGRRAAACSSSGGTELPFACASYVTMSIAARGAGPRVVIECT